MNKDPQKKTAIPAEPAADTSTGSAADVEAIMRKYDRESNTRVWEGAPKTVVRVISVAFALFCIWVTLFGNFLEQTRLTSFIGSVIIIGFLNYPARKGEKKKRKRLSDYTPKTYFGEFILELLSPLFWLCGFFRIPIDGIISLNHCVQKKLEKLGLPKRKVRRVNFMPWYDILLMAVGAFAFFYHAFNAKDIISMGMKASKDAWLIGLGIAGILVLAELCRRSVGIPILCVAGAFLVYAIFNTKGGIPRLVYDLFYKDNGVLSTPINVCSKYIVVFIIFGAFLERTGISNFFISMANALCGRFAGGPAKVAVVSSALCGMVSGSSVGNTVTTGSVTIPMMKKTGYKPEFAGAVEAAASTGGQIMPPIMGAAAFLMAEYVGVPYSDIIVRAILPAVLYFLGIFIAVHLEAKKLGLKGIPKEMLPRMKQLVKDTYLLLPLIILVYLVCSNTRTMQFSAAVAIVAAIAVGFINNLLTYYREKKVGGEMTNKSNNPVKATFGIGGGFGISNILDSLEAGGKGCISVGVACGIAGLIAGCLSVTGLASTLINGIVKISGSSSILALLLTMLCCIVLGMGVPTTANYCIMASTCAPILIQMNIPTVAAHFFVFYFGIVADITPPVALAAYAGSAIAKSNPMKTGITATRLAIAAFIIPFVFAYSPAILFIGENIAWYEIVVTAVTATIGMIGVAAGLSGYLLKDMNIVERLLVIAGGITLIIPGTLTDVIGLALIGVVIAMQLLTKNKATTLKA